MAVQWAIVQNVLLPLDPAEKLPSFVPGLSAAAPSASGLTISQAETLVIAGENIDAVKSFCLAQGGTAVSSSGGSLYVSIDRSVAGVRVMVTGRSDLSRRTPLTGSTLTAVASTVSSSANSAMSGDSDADA